MVGNSNNYIFDILTIFVYIQREQCLRSLMPNIFLNNFLNNIKEQL